MKHMCPDLSAIWTCNTDYKCLLNETMNWDRDHWFLKVEHSWIQVPPSSQPKGIALGLLYNLSMTSFSYLE